MEPLSPNCNPTLAGMPAEVIEGIAQHLLANSAAPHLSYAPQADVLHLALTCKRICPGALSQLYTTIVIPDLPALPLLARALSDQPNQAQRVRTIALAPTFLDLSQDDLHLGLTKLIKYAPHGCANPDAFKLKYIGKDTGQSLLMAWFTHFASLTPNLRGIDLSRTSHFPPHHALGFCNLAPVLRQRGAWFRGPRTGLFPLAMAASIVHPQDEVVPYKPDPSDPFPRRLPYLITFIDYGRKWVDLQNPSMAPEQLISFNLHPLEALVESTDDWMQNWKCRNITFTDPGDADPFRSFFARIPHKSLRFAYGCADQGFVLYLDKAQRMPAPTTLPTADMPLPKYGGTISLHVPNMDVAYEALHKLRMHPQQCTNVTLSHTIRPDILAAKPQEYWRYIRSLSDFQSRGVGRAFQNPWVNVTSLTLGLPLFTKAPTQKALESLVLLSDYTHAFPNVTSLTLEPYHTSINDCLIVLDVFLRRHPTIGKPLRELAIYRQSPDPGMPTIMHPPPITDLTTGKPVPVTRLDMRRATPGLLHKLVLVDKAQYPPNPNHADPHVLMIHPGLLHGIRDLNVRLAGAPLCISPPRLATPTSASFPSADQLDWNNPLDQPLPLGSVRLPALRSLMVSVDHYTFSPWLGEVGSPDASFPDAPNLHSLYVDGDFCEVFTVPEMVYAVVEKYPEVRNVYVAYTWFSGKQIDEVRREWFSHPVRGLRPLPRLSRLVLVNDPEPPSLFLPQQQGRKRAAARKPIDWASEGVWCMGDVGSVFLSDLKVPGGFDLLPVEDGVIVRRLPKADLGPEPEALHNRIPSFGQRCKCGKQRMGAVASAADNKVRPMRARQAKRLAKESAKASDHTDDKVAAWVDAADGVVLCAACHAERNAPSRCGRRVWRCAKVTDSREVVGEGVWPLSVTGGRETVRIESMM